MRDIGEYAKFRDEMITGIEILDPKDNLLGKSL